MPGIDVCTFDDSDGTAKDGADWCTISFRVWELLRAATDAKPEEFPILRRLEYYGAFEVMDQSDLVELIEETERVLGNDEDFRRTMGHIHGAAVHSWATGNTVSFLGEARIEY
jgi:hypothetical protein